VDNMEQKKPVELIMRGALGAAAGCFLWLVLSYAYSGVLVEAWQLLIVGFFVLGLWTSLVVGGVTGIAIWVIHYWTGTDLGVIARVILGIVTAFIFMALYLFVHGDLNRSAGGLSAPLWFSLFFAIAVGGLAGVLVGSQIHAESV
jgi:hypothetical protein